jgi:signal recognition particle GTPase
LPGNTVFEDAMNYLVDHKLIQNFIKLPNTVFIPGLGGTGKTSATAKYAVDYLIDVMGLKESDIWLSAPTAK